MDRLHSWCQSLLAGVIAAALLALLAVGIETGLAVRQERARRNSEQAMLLRQLDMLEKRIALFADQRAAAEKELEDAGVWRSPVNYVAAVKCWTDSSLQEFRLNLELGRKRVDYVKSASRSMRDLAMETAGKSFLPGFVFFLLLIFLGPVIWKICLFYGVARWLEGCRFVQLVPRGTPGGAIRSFESDFSLVYPLAEGEKLYLRAGNWCKKRTDLQARTRFFWNIRYPLVSLAADLVELLEVSSLPGRNGSVTIASPEADMFIARITVSGDEGVVIRPRHLVAVSDGICIRTKWSFHIHNLVAGHIRQIVLYGNGAIFVTGGWGVTCQQVPEGGDCRIEDNLILGYEMSSEYALGRTETFWHYLCGSATLFDFRIRRGCFLVQNNHAVRRNGTVLEKILGAVCNGVGHILGF